MNRYALGVRVLIIDNQSSFSYNLAHYIAEVTGCSPKVLVNSVSLPNDLSAFDCALLSPGPGSPERCNDMGSSRVLLQRCELPVLGVCLGYQGLGHQYGAAIFRSVEPWHGRQSTIVHDGGPLFSGIPTRFQAARYHSLELRDPLPANLSCVARTDEGAIMAIQHKTLPQWGVQFHPESIATEYGHQLLANFCALSATRRTTERQKDGPSYSFPARLLDDRHSAPPRAQMCWRLDTRVLDVSPSADVIFKNLFGESATSFWLDGGANRGYSFLGDASGPKSYELWYEQASLTLHRRQRGVESSQSCDSVFDFLAAELASNLVDDTGVEFDFCGGFVGYLGYELGRVCTHKSHQPDAGWLWVDRYIAYCHGTGTAIAVALIPVGDSTAAADDWFAAVQKRMMGHSGRGGEKSGSDNERDRGTQIMARSLRDPRERYQANIERCKHEITVGECYQLCLTTQWEADVSVDSLALFLDMRRRNPAPYSSYLRYPTFSVASASPERFLRIERDGSVESKPIKGTSRRDPDLSIDMALANELLESEKEQAENLMIVDLVRNDLARSCQAGSVVVDGIASLESYATVYQLVSTIRGRLQSEISPVHCVRNAFPGGSMTGAPKKRAMSILEDVETGPRGIYSGSIGYLSINGVVDLSIVIRSVVVEANRVRIGTGGAITQLSDPSREFDEMELKAESQFCSLDGVLCST